MLWTIKLNCLTLQINFSCMLRFHMIFKMILCYKSFRA
ncbi:hypothetical protein X975_26514, partial [Stegodyphus mimosarum]